MPGAVRIVGGLWKRRLLQVVEAPGLRPTADRTRETLFNWLTHTYQGDFHGLAVLDLFAGSGALGFEAASRGAGPVTLVENNPAAADALTAAQRDLGATQIEIRVGDAMRIASQLHEQGKLFDLIFLDPPFGQRWLQVALPLASRLCTPRGFVYAESEAPLAPGTLAPLGLSIHRVGHAGEVFYHLLQRNIEK